jgi:hypothetical protein
LAEQVERMEHRLLQSDGQIALARRALALRFPSVAESGMRPSQLLSVRRASDGAEDLWSTLNKVQENLIRGGLRGGRRAAG